MTHTTSTKTGARRRSGLILTALVAAGLAGGMLAPAIASAAEPADNSAPVSSQGWNTSAFRVDNMSGYTLRQTGVTTNGQWEPGMAPPADGSTIVTGEGVHYELETRFTYDVTADITYDVVNSANQVVGTVTGHMWVNHFGGEAWLNCTCTGSIKCQSNGWDTITVTQ